MGFINNVNVDVRGAAHIAPCTYKTVVLKQNVTKENLNVLTQAMLDEWGRNTKFVIKWDYILTNDIIVPKHCLIEFDGGSVDGDGYTLTGDDTILIYNLDEDAVLKNVVLSGTFIRKTGGETDKKDNTDGMGKIILVNDKPFGEQLTQENTIYVIKYDFTLVEDITIPANCVLEFDGGSLSNGTIVGQDTIISHQNTCIFNNVYLDGSYIKDNVSYSNLFNIEYDDKALFESLDRIGYNIYLNSSRVYNLSSSVNIYAKSVYSDKRATINIYHVSDTNSSGLIFQSPESEVHNVLFVGHYDEIAGHDVYNGCAIGAYVSDESRTEPKRSLHIHDCKFEGHYASSIILSSYITHAIIENCDFSNVIVEDHVVYFTEAIKGITIKNCLISISSTASISGRANKIKVRNASCDVVIEGVNMSNASDLFAAEDMKSLTSIVFKDVNINTESEVSAGANTPIASIVNSEIESLKFVSCKISVNNESGNFKQLVYTGSNTTREVKNLEVNSCDFTNISLAFTCPVRKYTIANSKYSNIDAPHNDTRVLWTRDNTQINILCVGCTFTMKGDALFKVISPAKIIIIGSDIGGNVIGIISHETQTVADYLSLYGNTYSGVARLVNSASIGVVMYTDDYTKLPQNFNSNYKWLNATFGKTVERPNGAYIDRGHVFFDKDLYSELIAVYKDDSNNVKWKKSIYVSPEVKTHGPSSDRPEGNTTNYGFCFLDTDLGHPIFVSNMSGTTNYWKDADGATSGVNRSGATADRPSGKDIYVGFQYFDTSLGDNGKTIWAAAIAETSPYTVTWVDATGTPV